MKRIMVWSLLLVSGFAMAGADGELGWTSLSFCNGAGYCVDASSPTGSGIQSLRMKRDGKEIAIPADATKDVQLPLLNQVRLVNVFRTDKVRQNRLEIPFFKLVDGQPNGRFVLSIVVINDEVVSTAVTPER